MSDSDAPDGTEENQAEDDKTTEPINPMAELFDSLGHQPKVEREEQSPEEQRRTAKGCFRGLFMGFIVVPLIFAAVRSCGDEDEAQIRQSQTCSLARVVNTEIPAFNRYEDELLASQSSWLNQMASFADVDEYVADSKRLLLQMAGISLSLRAQIEPCIPEDERNAVVDLREVLRDKNSAYRELQTAAEAGFLLGDPEVQSGLAHLDTSFAAQEEWVCRYLGQSACMRYSMRRSLRVLQRLHPVE